MIFNNIINDNCIKGIIVGNNEHLILLFNKLRSRINDAIYNNTFKANSKINPNDLNKTLTDTQIVINELYLIKNNMERYNDDIFDDRCSGLLCCLSRCDCETYECAANHIIAIVIDLEIYKFMFIDIKIALKLLKDRYNIYAICIYALTPLYNILNTF